MTQSTPQKDSIRKGIEFAQKHKTESEPYNSGIGYGFACGYEQCLLDLNTPPQVEKGEDLNREVRNALIEFRAYFLTHDKTTHEHYLYSLAHNLISRLKT